MDEQAHRDFPSIALNNSFIDFPFFARSALYVRAHSQNWNVSVCVRPESNYFFPKGNVGGGHVPLDLGVLNDRFFRF